MLFRNRQQAGEQLAARLQPWSLATNTIILALPRGGVVLGATVAEKLQLPLDIIVPRKIGAPGNAEFAIGAITEDGQQLLNPAVPPSHIDERYLQKTIQAEVTEAQRRVQLYRGDRAPLQLPGKTAVLVDDGIATGLTMLAAIQSARKRGAKKIIVAVPVAAKDSIASIQSQADEVICLATPEPFYAVGQWYEEFDQVSDEEVIARLRSTAA